MRRFTDKERRARLGRRHCLAPGAGAGDPVELADRLVALHATDPATVFLAVRARVPDATVASVERALYEDRTLLRMIAMRRTMFVFTLELAAIVKAAATEAVAAAQRRRYAKLLEDAGIAADGDAWLREAEEATAAALEARGQAFGRELSADVPMLREKIAFGEGKTWAGSVTMTTWVLFQLAAEGRIVRARPRGSWTSSQWSWVPTERWLAEPLSRLEPEEARTELARRWLAAFGPALVTDLKWWTGWSLTHTRAALAVAGAVEVELEAGPGVALPDDLEPEPETEPWAAFLPALDPTVMGWKERAWYLGPHRETLFDTAGNAGPTVWRNGRIVGGWAVRRDGEVAYRLLEDVGRGAAAAIEAEASQLTVWLGKTGVIPRFGTPLARELAG